MSGAKHTPGPWQFSADLPSIDPTWHIVTNKTRMRVVANVHIEPGNEMDLANARLIAAAPDLLAALKSQVVAHQQLCYAADLDEQAHLDGTAEARAAIAKAEGR